MLELPSLKHRRLCQEKYPLDTNLVKINTLFSELLPHSAQSALIPFTIQHYMCLPSVSGNLTGMSFTYFGLANVHGLGHYMRWLCSVPETKESADRHNAFTKKSIEGTCVSGQTGADCYPTGSLMDAQTVWSSVVNGTVCILPNKIIPDPIDTDCSSQSHAILYIIAHSGIRLH